MKILKTPRLLPLALLLACEGETELLTVRVWGEAYIEEGIPTDAFVDGWSVKFDRFLVSVGEVEVASSAGGETLAEPRFQVFDLARPSDGAGHQLTGAEVSPGRYDVTAFTIAPAADLVAGNASTADLETLRAGGFSLYVVGSASKGDVKKTFRWGFTTRTRYDACESLAQVRGGEPADVQLTIHGDHLFYDDLFSDSPNVTFDLIAGADGDGDGEVTQAELSAVDLRPLANYQVGSTDIVDLWRFIEQQTTTLGHIDGEGHCEATREP